MKHVLVLLTDALINVFIATIILLAFVLVVKHYIDYRDRTENIRINDVLYVSDLLKIIYKKLPNAVIVDVILTERGSIEPVTGISIHLSNNGIKEYVYFCPHILDAESVNILAWKYKRLADHPVCVAIDRNKIIDDLLKKGVF